MKEMHKKQRAVGGWPEIQVSRGQRSGEKGIPVYMNGAQWSMFGVTGELKNESKEPGKL